MMKRSVLTLIMSALFVLFLAIPVMAQNGTLPLPRFVSLTANEVNMRTGPGQRYPITWFFKKRHLPVEIINEFDTWRKIKDITGDEGWVHQSMLSGRRYMIIKEKPTYIYAQPKIDSAPIVRVEAGVMGQMPECQIEWCYVQVDGFKGWIKKEDIWGAYPNETFE